MIAATSARRAARTLAVGVASSGLALLTGCGVPLETQAQQLPPDAVATDQAATARPSVTVPSSAPSRSGSGTSDASASASAAASGTVDAVATELWFVGDDGLVPVAVLLPPDPQPQLLLDLLAFGAPAGHRELRTVVSDPTGSGPLVVVSGDSGPTATTDPSQVPGVVTVSVREPFAALPPAEQVLVLGQVVLTLTDGGASAVRVTDAAGTTLAIPAPDGRLLDAPATAADYRSLAADG